MALNETHIKQKMENHSKEKIVTTFCCQDKFAENFVLQSELEKREKALKKAISMLFEDSWYGKICLARKQFHNTIRTRG